MPDIINVIFKKWKLIFGLTVLATVIALIAAYISPKKYLGTATAIPVNSVVSDKAHIFNPNIESLYSEFGLPDDLDKIEGAAALDTIFIAAALDFDLAAHYQLPPSGEAKFKAARNLKKNTDISKSAYGELKIKVWDKDRNLAAAIANSLLQKLQDLYQHLQNENNSFVLQKLQEDYDAKQEQYKVLVDTSQVQQIRKSALLDRLKEDLKLIDQYEIAVKTNPPVLITVESARAPLWPDKPNIMQTVTFTFFSALVFSFLLSLFIEGRRGTGN